MKLPYLLIMLSIFQITRNSDVNLISNSDDIDDNKDAFFNKCYDDLGCIETDGRWYDPVYRPVNLEPLDRNIIRTEFLLLKPNLTIHSTTTSLQYKNVIAESDSLKIANFSNNYRTILLIHDFTSNGYTGWIKHYALKLLTFCPNLNLISVDWQRGAEPPFDQAISNARLVALEIVQLIKALKSFGISAQNVEIVGHGVGAHIGGYVGQHHTVNKITGLDPSGPRFAQMPDVVKLNPNCARYVEVLHTDAFNDKSQGSTELLGHSDFFINNAHLQPGCIQNSSKLIKVDRNTLNAGQILSGCSHKRAFKYYIEALFNKHCTFIGIPCENHELFIKGRCVNCGGRNSSGCRAFGLNFYEHSKQRLSFYLNTNQEAPFCVFQYVISVELNSTQDYYGYFNFLLIDERNDVANATLRDVESNDRNFFHNSSNKFVYYAKPPKLLKIQEAKVQWNEKKKLYCIVYCKQSIFVKRVTIKPITSERVHKSELCPVSGSGEIDNEAYTTFVPCNFTGMESGTGS